MDKIFLFPILPLLIILILLFIYYKSRQIKKIYKEEVLKGVEEFDASDKLLITEDDIKHLPEPVQKYLDYTGVTGKEKVQNARIKLEIEMNLGPGKGWSLMQVEQFDFFGMHPGRLSFMKFKVKGIPTYGLDSYIDRKGHMLMKPAGLITLVDAKGNELDDKSAAAILLSEMCTAAPSTLIDKRIEWEVIDPLTVKALFNDRGLKVSGILKFNENGELINFSSEDKYYAPEGKYYKKTKWSTSVKDYKVVNGFKLSTSGDAVWHFDEGDFCYGKAYLKELEYNSQSFI